MPDKRWKNLKDIFHAAVALPQDERQSYVEKACGHDESPRAAIETLLKTHKETANLVDDPAYQALIDLKRLRHSLQLNSDIDAGAKTGQCAVSARIPAGLTTVIHPISSAEYLLSQVKDHKRGIALALWY